MLAISLVLSIRTASLPPSLLLSLFLFACTHCTVLSIGFSPMTSVHDPCFSLFGSCLLNGVDVFKNVMQRALVTTRLFLNLEKPLGGGQKWSGGEQYLYRIITIVSLDSVFLTLKSYLIQQMIKAHDIYRTLQGIIALVFTFPSSSPSSPTGTHIYIYVYECVCVFL